jgi:hypothetical protein
VSGDLAVDTFTRTAASLGTADTGGLWTPTTSGTVTVATNGASAASTHNAGATIGAMLTGVSSRESEVLCQFWFTSLSGGGSYFAVVPRGLGANQYRARILVNTSGVITLATRRATSVLLDAALDSVTVPGTYTAPAKLWCRAQAYGVSPTTIRARVWFDGNTEPSTWHVTSADSTAGFQGAGAVGMWSFTSGTSSAGSVINWDNFEASAMPGPAGRWGVPALVA